MHGHILPQAGVHDPHVQLHLTNLGAERTCLRSLHKEYVNVYYKDLLPLHHLAMVVYVYLYALNPSEGDFLPHKQQK